MDHQNISHDAPLVALSFAAALLSSYTALEMGSRLRRASGKARWIWLGASVLVLGGGIWSMNFIAILAMKFGVPVAYGFNWAALSLATAIAGVALGFHIITRPNPSRAQQIIASCVAGLGLAAVPYTGMSAVMFDGRFAYNPWIVSLSIVTAMVAATSALWFAFNLATSWRRAGAALVMALAVSGTHVTAMAATSIELFASTSGLVDPSARLDLASPVAVGLFFVLCISMVCVFADRRFEFLVDREKKYLRAAQKSLVDSQASIRMLFDNAEQGFLIIDRALVIGPQYSASCEVILGQTPAGKNIADMLCPGPGGKGEVMRATLLSVFGDANAFARELKLDLLPKEVELNGRFIKVGYKGLADPDALMIILTDVTEATLLAQEVERERMRLEMIVLGFTEGEAFASLVNDYRRFLALELKELVTRVGEQAGRSEFYRRLHTFKGLLAQFNFPRSPAAIHGVETALIETSVSPLSAFELLGLDRLADAFDQDMGSVSDLLGPGFDAPGGRILVAQTHVRTMEQLARVALIGASSSTVSIPLRMLLQTLTALGRFNAKCLLGFHSRCIPTLASRLEKELEPVLVEGDDVTLAPERYGEFFRSLVHVFRNAVDHGIEAPALRVRAGKERAGSIRCLVRDRSGVLEILIADDGAGVDRTALEKKLVAGGAREVDVQSMALSDLVFREGLSSRDAASQISGRGVGLAAVKAELDRLGGHVSVESELGLGTAFTFTFAYEVDNEPNAEAGMFERIAV